MDTTFMTDVVASGTIMLTSLVGALFSFITAILPVLLGLVAVGFVVWGIKRIIGKMRGVR